MLYVNADDLMERFKRYIREYDGKVMSVDAIMEELRDAIDDSDFMETDE